MRYYALATDYDGTLATDGKVDNDTLACLDRLKASGRKLILVTGRELDDLARTFGHFEYFDRIVAENGALVYNPVSREEKILCEPPPGEFVGFLRSRGVHRISVGRVIVATWEPYQNVVLEAIRELGLELHVIFNKGAVMVLPSGINKATGLKSALADLSLSAHNIVGIGDAENDHTFLNMCECSVAVDNALPMLKKAADLVTQGARGEGVQELAEILVATDLRGLDEKLTRHHVALGFREDGEPVTVPPYGISMLLAGTSGGGKSTFATGFMERLSEKGYQFCIIDPEGDYQNFEHAVVLGDSNSAPAVDAVLQVLAKPEDNAVVNMLGVSMEERPRVFDRLLPALLELRARTGRPHWIIIDETHHLLPSSWDVTAMTVRGRVDGLLLITVHPNFVSQVVLSSVDLILAIGKEPAETIKLFSRTMEQAAPWVPDLELEKGEAIGWWCRPPSDPFWFKATPPKAERRRHRRKYAEGELPPERSFFFRGPEGKLNLRAQNLKIFMQLAEGVDDATWEYHRTNEDYSAWFRRMIKDDDLADAVRDIEKVRAMPADESRRKIREKIEERYTGEA